LIQEQLASFYFQEAKCFFIVLPLYDVCRMDKGEYAGGDALSGAFTPLECLMYFLSVAR
jgi:hypothetical protein